MTPEARAKKAAKRSAAKLRRARKALVSPEVAKARIEERFGAGSAPTTLPRHVRPYGNFMREFAKHEPTRREVIKAYAVARSSVQRQGRKRETLCERFPEYKPLKRMMQEESSVRPEDVFSVLLFSPHGQKYLDAAERGTFDADSAREIVSRMRCFGLDQTLQADLKRAVAMGDKTDVVRAKLRAPVTEWIDFVKRDVYGVSAAKAGFFAALLGRGDTPTFDAREIKLWRKKPARKELTSKERDKLGCAKNEKGKFTGKLADGTEDRRCKPLRKFEPSAEDVLAYRDNVRAYPMTLEPEHEPFREHLVHHALWDAYPDDAGTQAKTTHGAIIRAMQFAGLGTKRRRR